MKIPTELLNKWKGLRSRGDNKQIEDETGVPSVNVSRAFEGRECREETFIAIRDFYTAREARLFPPAVNTQNQSHE